MNKLITAVIFVATSSYFSNPIGTAEAAHRHHHHRHHSSNYPTENYRQSIASWYGAEFHGKRTASGERFNMYALTAAHKTLPLSSYVEVKNLQNNRTVIVKINDRGPFHSRRAMDLSYAAAKELGMNGTAEIQITPIVDSTAYTPVETTVTTAANTPTEITVNTSVNTPKETTVDSKSSLAELTSVNTSL